MSEPKTEYEIEVENAVKRIRKGDVSAFEVIVRHFERPLRVWLAAQSAPGVDVDDVAQRSFIAAYTRLGDYTTGTNFGAWLFTIARYQLKTETTRLRRVADYQNRYAPDLLQQELDRRDSALPSLQAQRLEYLRKCLEQMESRLKRYITWRYDEGIPLEEMAQRSERSVAAVKKQLWQLRRRLHDCVESRLSDEGGLA